MNFKNLSLMSRNLISTIPILFGTILVSVTTEVMVSSSNANSEVKKAVEMVHLVETSELEMVKMSEALRGYLLYPERTEELERKKQADENYAKISTQLQELIKDDKDIADLNQQMINYDGKELDEVENKIADLIKDNSPEAKAFYLKTYAPARDIQTHNFEKLKDLITKKSESIIKKSEDDKVYSARMTILTLIGSVLVGILFMLWNSYAAVKSIREVALNLSENTANINNTATSISTTSTSISEASTQQASSLAQTAASLEQITAMIGKATDSANQSAQHMTTTQQKVEQGREAVDQVLGSMNEISESNEMILNQVVQSNEQLTEIVKLIEQIGDKTKVINDIVFQTKLLSFNASVEAARAGEHGKGFAVVAEEVGSLAQMSGNASKEISNMLSGSIEKVHSIVAETKTKVESLVIQGKEKVEGGIQVAQQCSDILNQIVQDIAEVTTLAHEISNASREQSQGVSEINKAVSELDSVTQKNAGISESAAGAAKELNHQAIGLEKTVDNLVSLVEGQKKAA